MTLQSHDELRIARVLEVFMHFKSHVIGSDRMQYTVQTGPAGYAPVGGPTAARRVEDRSEVAATLTLAFFTDEQREHLVNMLADLPHVAKRLE